MNSSHTMEPNDLYSNALDTISNCYESLKNDKNALLKLDNHSLLMAILSSVSKINGKIVDIFNAENENAINAFLNNDEKDTTDCCNNNNNHSTDNTDGTQQATEMMTIDDVNGDDCNSKMNNKNDDVNTNGLSSTLCDFVDNNNNNNKSHNGCRSLSTFDESAKNSNNNNAFKQTGLTCTGKYSQNKKRGYVYYDVGSNNASLKSRFSVPIISSLKWGEMVVSYNNEVLTFKDCILSPNQAECWDWSNDGTHHNPGITIKAVKNVIDDCDIIILTKGINSKLQTSPKTIQFMKRQKKKSFYILETRKAVLKYHQLIDENYKSVGGLFHSTC